MREAVSELLPDGVVLHEATSLKQALEVAVAMRPHVLIVDARREHLPRPDVMRQLGLRMAMIYVADGIESAQQAFDGGAIDCVMNTVSLERLELALMRAFSWARMHRQRAHGAPRADPAPIALHPQVRVHAPWLRVVHGTELLVVRPEDVIYLEAHQKITRVLFAHGEGHLRCGISTIAARLDPVMFWRIHRSIIVNAQHVSSIGQDEMGRVTVRLKGRRDVLHASRAHARALLSDGPF